jgi:hypothetical protein
MSEDTWVEYGTPGTTVLSLDDIDLAISRLEWLWEDATARARAYLKVTWEPDEYNCWLS